MVELIYARAAETKVEIVCRREWGNENIPLKPTQALDLGAELIKLGMAQLRREEKL